LYRLLLHPFHYLLTPSDGCFGYVLQWHGVSGGIPPKSHL
jgi:hypothetical protein